MEKAKRESPIGVAVLDTGISPHPDFGQRILAFRDFVNKQTYIYDDGGHGTHVAGCIGGNGKMSRGIYSGMHPGCFLVVGKVLNEKGEGNIGDMVEAIDWILLHREMWNIRIVNISVGMGAQNRNRRMPELLDKIDEAWKEGLVVVCAAGNDGPKPMSISVLGAGKQVITVGCHEGDFSEKAQICVRNIPAEDQVFMPFGNRILLLPEQELYPAMHSSGKHLMLQRAEHPWQRRLFPAHWHYFYRRSHKCQMKMPSESCFIRQEIWENRGISRDGECCKWKSFFPSGNASGQEWLAGILY